MYKGDFTQCMTAFSGPTGCIYMLWIHLKERTVFFSPEDPSRSPMRDQDRSRLFCFAGKQTSKQQKNRKCSGAGLDIST